LAHDAELVQLCREACAAPQRIERPASENAAAALRAGPRPDSACASPAADTAHAAGGDGRPAARLDALAGIEASIRRAGGDSRGPGSRRSARRFSSKVRWRPWATSTQALAGAIATGTHGTGSRLRSLSNQVVGLRLLTADGSPLECSETSAPRVFAAARVALGAFGVVTSVRLRLLPAYQLHERIWREPVEPALETLPERIASNRHFEFFWLPQKDRLELKALNPSTLPPGPVPDRRRERVGPAHEILPSPREVPIVEMEASRRARVACRAARTHAAALSLRAGRVSNCGGGRYPPAGF
jgi:FAD/FMN-containing dehydrogenase